MSYSTQFSFWELLLSPGVESWWHCTQSTMSAHRASKQGGMRSSPFNQILPLCRLVQARAGTLKKCSQEDFWDQESWCGVVPARRDGWCSIISMMLARREGEQTLHPKFPEKLVWVPAQFISLVFSIYLSNTLPLNSLLLKSEVICKQINQDTPRSKHEKGLYLQITQWSQRLWI